MSAPVLRATTDLVARAWLGSIPGFSVAMVGAQLPREQADYADLGFIQYEVVSGAPNSEVPMRMPVLSVSCWAVAQNSSKAPWGKANNLAETIAAACQDHPAVQRGLLLPGGFPDVQVFTAYLLNEPRRVYSDDGSYARSAFDMVLAWIELPS